jgi:hypothetical protein
MLVWEDGDTLRIGNAIPREWLRPGKRVAAKDAPTTFGPVSLSIESKPHGTMRVHFKPLTRSKPSKIMVRLRHPESKDIADAKSLSGTSVEYKGDMLVLKNLSTPADLVVSFKK